MDIKNLKLNIEQRVLGTKRVVIHAKMIKAEYR